MRLKAAGYLLLFLLGASLILLAPRPPAAAAATDTMRLRGWNEAPITFTKPATSGMKLVSMLQLQPRTDTNETTWTALSVSATGTLPSSNINSVRIYSTTQTTQFDYDQNTFLGSAPVDTTITFTTPQAIDTDTTTYYFVVFQLTTASAVGQTVGARITDKTRVAVGAPDEVAFISNLDSKISTIVDNPHGSPGNTGAYENTNFCSACHNVHMAKTNRRILNKLVTRDEDVVNNNPATVYNALCFSCHDGTGADNNLLQYYDPANGYGKQKGANTTASPGHMIDQTGTIDTTGYLPNINYNSGKMLPCLVCHDVHYSKWGNYVLLADELYEYAKSPSQTTTNTTESYYWDSSETIWASPNALTDAAVRRKRCEVCHRNHNGTSDSTSTSGTGSWVDGKSVVVGIDLGRPGTHADDEKKRDDWCGGCHGVHEIRVPDTSSSGESSGGEDCGGCHGTTLAAMKESSTYHHYMNNAGATALGSSKYPFKDTFESSETDAPERRCLMCHADHDVFSPGTGLTKANGNRAKNLRSSITTTPTHDNTASFSNSDFINDANGGICISCHKNSQFKNTANQTGTAGQDSTTTMIVEKQPYAEATTAHNYDRDDTTSTDDVTSTFKGLAADNANNRPFEFRANCVKCHNTLDRNSWAYSGSADTSSKQDSTYKFQLHSTQVRRLLAWLNIVSASQTAVQDPLEENFCNGCHSTNTADNPFAGLSKDYYNRAGMSAAALGIKAAIANNSPRNHPVGSTKGKHKAVEGQSPNWNPRTNRHVECEDCHNPHSAKKGNHVQGESAAGGAIRGTWGVTPSGWEAAMEGTATFTDTSKTVTGTGTSWLTTMAGAGVWYIKNNWDMRGFWYKVDTVNTDTKLTLARPFNGTMMPGGWSGSPAVSYMAVKVSYSRVDTITDEAELCLKCHSTYAFDDDPPATPSLHAYGSSTSETEIGFDFSPDNLAYHPVMAIGKNQPIWPTGSVSGTSSIWNHYWPQWNTGTVTVNTSGIATFSANMPVPPVRKGWYLHVGSTLSTSANSTQTQNWYQISEVTSRTVASVTPEPSSTLSNQNYTLTAGLGNTFVAPWGPWSKVVCSDCHGANGTGTSVPEGPHGSANKWILKETTNASSFNFVFLAFNGGTSTVSPNSSGVNWNPALSPKNFCVNCHRRDVYGDVGGSGYYDNANTTVDYEYRLGRQPHDPTGNGSTYLDTKLNSWGIVCMNCHGGSAMGGIHGTSVKESRDPGASWAALSVSPPTNKPGERFLNGATWAGVRRARTDASPSCWTRPSIAPTDEVNGCDKGHRGTTPGSGAYANYDY